MEMILKTNWIFFKKRSGFDLLIFLDFYHKLRTRYWLIVIKLEVRIACFYLFALNKAGNENSEIVIEALHYVEIFLLSLFEFYKKCWLRELRPTKIFSILVPNNFYAKF